MRIVGSSNGRLAVLLPLSLFSAPSSSASWYGHALRILAHEARLHVSGTARGLAAVERDHAFGDMGAC